MQGSKLSFITFQYSVVTVKIVIPLPLVLLDKSLRRNFMNTYKLYRASYTPRTDWDAGHPEGIQMQL